MSEVIQANNHSIPGARFHEDLLGWGTVHKRVFPWRTTNNPFHIMIAELMLRRTQARQVVGIYNDFITKYPDAKALASAPSEEVAQSLFSLGLAWRVLAFQRIAQTLVDQYNGTLPPDYDQLTALPGIGDYVASAVCCFAFGQPIIMVDTNTVRVVGRLFGLPTHAESRRRKPIRALLQALLDQQFPKSYNYALLDMAALVCMPADPNCKACPLLAYCVTGQERLACLTH